MDITLGIVLYHHDWVSTFLLTNGIMLTNEINDIITTFHLLTQAKLLALIDLNDAINIPNDVIISFLNFYNIEISNEPHHNIYSLLTLFHNMNLISIYDSFCIHNPKFIDLISIDKKSLYLLCPSQLSYAEALRYIMSSDKCCEVVSVKVSDIRPKYHDLEEWCNDSNNIYIGRKGVVFITRNNTKYRFPKSDSIWANPFKINSSSSREDVIIQYKSYIIGKIQSGNITKEQLLSLKGKTLGCWCKTNGEDIPCHGDVLLEIVSTIC